MTRCFPLPWLALVAALAGCGAPAPLGPDPPGPMVYDLLNPNGAVVGELAFRIEGPTTALDAALRPTPALRVAARTSLDLPGFGSRLEEFHIDTSTGRILEVLRPCDEGSGCPPDSTRWVLGSESDAFPFGAPLVAGLSPGDWTLRLPHFAEVFEATARIELLPDGSRVARFLEPPSLPTLLPCSILSGELRLLPDGTVAACTSAGEGSALRLREGRWPASALEPQAMHGGIPLREREPPGYPGEGNEGPDPFPLPEAVAAALLDEGARFFQARHGPIDLLGAESVLHKQRSVLCTGVGCATHEESQTWEVSFIGRDGEVWEVVVRQDEARGPGDISLRRDRIVESSKPAPPLVPVARPYAGALVALDASRAWIAELGLPPVTGHDVLGKVVGPSGGTALRRMAFADVEQPEASDSLHGWFVAWDAESGLLAQAVLSSVDLAQTRARIAG